MPMSSKWGVVAKVCIVSTEKLWELILLCSVYDELLIFVNTMQLSGD